MRRFHWSAAVVIVAALIGLYLGGPDLVRGEQAVVVPPPALDDPKVSSVLQTAVVAGGCFWGVQGVYQHVRGVHKAVSGYSGGTKATADYETVSRGDTGHAESVEIVFDPKEISYGEILQIFFSVVHDPTQLNRQGPDVGTQYRSAIFYASDSQKRIAQAYITQLGKAKVFRREIATKVDPLHGFYAAEAYHQDFLINNPTYPYIVVHDLPKIESFKKLFSGRYREQPVLARSAR